MHEKVREYIERKEQERLEKAEERKRQHLIRLGLFKKKGDYSLSSKTSNTGIVPLEVTDEEYAIICSYDKEESNSENSVAVVLKFFGWIIIIGGLLVGFLMVQNGEVDSVILPWVVSTFSGVIILGFAEIIKLLQELVDKER